MGVFIKITEEKVYIEKVTKPFTQHSCFLFFSFFSQKILTINAFIIFPSIQHILNIIVVPIT